MHAAIAVIALISISSGDFYAVVGQAYPSITTTSLSDEQQGERKQKYCESQAQTGRWKALRKAMKEFSSTASSSTYIAGLAATATIAATAAAVAAFEREAQERDIQAASPASLVSQEGVQIYKNGDLCNSSSKAHMSESLLRTRRGSSFHYAEDVEYVEGAKLLTASLHLLSSSAGVVADTVRIFGDTAAGVAGSSIKVMGSAVKSVGSGMESAGNILEGSHNRDISSRRPMSSEIYKEAAIDSVGVRSLMGSTRSLAVQSVR